MKKYTPVKSVNTLIINVRGLQYAVHTWGNEGGHPVFLLHGWADTGMSFQFVADILPDDYYLIAPDWRGFGDTTWNTQGYWFPDYLADLEVLMNFFSDEKTVSLVGHSMGGNVACLYAGIRPHRISHLVSMDVFGLPESNASDAPERYGKWLDQIDKGTSFSAYPGLEQMISHINKLASGLETEKARFIAESWTKPSINGEFLIKADPAHKRVNPILYRREEAKSCWRKITAKSMLIIGEESRIYETDSNDSYRQDFRDCFDELEEKSIAGTGHMIHLQQPEKLAELLQTFLHD